MHTAYFILHLLYYILQIELPHGKGTPASADSIGERVQIHKDGDDFHFFSRSLKPVTAHKVEPFKAIVPRSCPHGDSLILDSEVLMVVRICRVQIHLTRIIIIVRYECDE
jgi:hypothetical protein